MDNSKTCKRVKFFSLGLAVFLCSSLEVRALEPDSKESAPELENLEAKVDALASDLANLREGLSIPEKDEFLSTFGMGPAASKIYGKESGLSMGGYGEFYFGHYLGEADSQSDPGGNRKVHRGDIYRFVTYLGYKFTDWLVMNSEIECEHSTTGKNKENGETGTVSVEFVYLDFLVSKYANFRTGLILVPMGITNEMHEPTTYSGNMRPEIERRIIPSTWRQAGLGVFGEIPFGFSYKAYLLSGLTAKGFDSKGIRGGRQKGNHFVWEDKAFVLRLDWSYSDLVNLGVSYYQGGADHDPSGSAETSNSIIEGHAQFRFKGLELRALWAHSWISGAAVLDDPATEEDESNVVPTSQYGYYLEGSYDFLPLLIAGTNQSFGPFLRFERLNLNHKMKAGQESDPKLDSAEVVSGLSWKPHPQVVVKGEYSYKLNLGKHDDASGQEVDNAPVQEIRLGAGFIF